MVSTDGIIFLTKELPESSINTTTLTSSSFPLQKGLSASPTKSSVSRSPSHSPSLTALSISAPHGSVNYSNTSPLSRQPISLSGRKGDSGKLRLAPSSSPLPFFLPPKSPAFHSSQSPHAASIFSPPALSANFPVLTSHSLLSVASSPLSANPTRSEYRSDANRVTPKSSRPTSAASSRTLTTPTRTSAPTPVTIVTQAHTGPVDSIIVSSSTAGTSSTACTTPSPASKPPVELSEENTAIQAGLLFEQNSSAGALIPEVSTPLLAAFPGLAEEDARLSKKKILASATQSDYLDNILDQCSVIKEDTPSHCKSTPTSSSQSSPVSSRPSLSFHSPSETEFSAIPLNTPLVESCTAEKSEQSLLDNASSDITLSAESDRIVTTEIFLTVDTSDIEESTVDTVADTFINQDQELEPSKEPESESTKEVSENAVEMMAASIPSQLFLRNTNGPARVEHPPISSMSSQTLGSFRSGSSLPRTASSLSPNPGRTGFQSPCFYHQRFVDAVDIERVLEEVKNDEQMSHSSLVQTATSVREISRQLQRRPIRRAVQNVMIVTKARDNHLVYLTRELAIWLMETPRYSSNVGVNVYVDKKLKTSKRFDAASIVSQHPKFETMLQYWTPDLCWSRPEVFDLVITLGGDGTVLFTSWLFQRIVPPILSFSLGSLGFLTTFEFGRYKDHLNRIMGQEGMKVNLRMRFTCTVYRAGYEDRERSGKDIEEPLQFEVLNELVIDRGPSPYVSNLELYGDDELLTIVQADGCIFSTPTGSTAYSLSAGGSLVHPDIPAILLTPICPHTLSFRPMVLSDTMLLRVSIPQNSRATAYCAFDGKGRLELRQGDYVTISASQFPFPTVTRNDTEWFDSVSRTLRWNTRAATQKAFDSSANLAASSRLSVAEMQELKLESENGAGHARSGSSSSQAEPEWDIDTDSSAYDDDDSNTASPLKRQMSMLVS